MILRGAQQQNEVTIQAFQHRETDRASQQKPNITHKKQGHRTSTGNLLRDLPEWFQEFTEDLEDEGVLASRDTPANISQDSDSEHPTKVVLRKYSICTHFPKTEVARSA